MFVLFFKTVSMYFTSCQKLVIYVQIISECLGIMADTALSSSWVVWLQQFQSWKKSKRSAWCQMQRENKFLFLTPCSISEFSRNPGLKDSTCQVYNVDIEMSRQCHHTSVSVLDCQLYYGCWSKNSAISFRNQSGLRS